MQSGSGATGFGETRKDWALRLECVLDDYDALSVFKSWMGVDDESSEHPLRLHFAIVAYREMSTRGDSRAAQLANDIYAKFLRPKGGLCGFIDRKTREAIGQRLKQQTAVANENDPALFDLCAPQVETFLRRQHALFVESREFLDFFNAHSSNAHPAIAKPYDQLLRPSDTRPSRRRSNSSNRRCGRGEEENNPPVPPRLTASTLLRTQKEREASLGQSSVEKLFKPVSRYPYVANAAASKKDSAVSSAFSSEVNAFQRQQYFSQHGATGGGTLPPRLMRDEQKRTNPVLLPAFQRPEPYTLAAHPRSGYNPSLCAQPSHESEEGRKHFARLLSAKLKTLQHRYKQYEEMSTQIASIANAGNSKSTARDVVKALSLRDDQSADYDDEAEVDDDVDNYFNSKILAAESESNGQCSSSSNPAIGNNRRSCSPEPTFASPFSPAHHATHLSMTAAASSQSPYALPKEDSADLILCDTGFGDDELSSRSRKKRAALLAKHMATSLQRHPKICSQQQSANQPSIAMSAFCTAAATAMPQGQLPQMQFPPAMGMTHSSILTPQHTSPMKSDSRQRATRTTYFAPPPGVVLLPPPPAQQHPILSSGLHSMFSPPFCAAPPIPPHRDNDLLLRTQRQQQLYASSHPSAPTQPHSHKQTSANTTAGKAGLSSDGDTSGIGSMTTTTATHFSEASTQPSMAAISHDKQRAAIFKKARELSAAQQSGQHPPADELTTAIAFTTTSTEPATMCISYKDLTAGREKIPVVAHVPRKRLTFREFRRYLSITSKDKRQFFFKAECDDGSAPYQLLLVTDDSAPLPIFDGKITAECRGVSPEQSD